MALFREWALLRVVGEFQNTQESPIISGSFAKNGHFPQKSPIFIGSFACRGWVSWHGRRVWADDILWPKIVKRMTFHTLWECEWITSRECGWITFIEFEWMAFIECEWITFIECEWMTCIECEWITFIECEWMALCDLWRNTDEGVSDSHTIPGCDSLTLS